MTRYEIPIDSRVMKWINQNISLTIEEKKLGSAEYHESVLDHIRSLCAKVGCLPCEPDAAIFWGESLSPKLTQKTATRKLGAREMKRLMKQGQFFKKIPGNRPIDSLELTWRRSPK